MQSGRGRIASTCVCPKKCPISSQCAPRSVLYPVCLKKCPISSQRAPRSVLYPVCPKKCPISSQRAPAISCSPCPKAPSLPNTVSPSRQQHHKAGKAGYTNDYHPCALLDPQNESVIFQKDTSFSVDVLTAYHLERRVVSIICA
ncbi:hypothetical protein Pmani_020638 [Petrolisthes manimaculis]|uniref:Uncharacterized protein n=1 Tax=Petrolisthes manimaculis TaxID=1843537 RepID=A0AAE1U644_9EUCA|nr:hypothetical protein Pmani_020638 [Petrolisthes manimaculis]